jgi:outer membrane receptor protein involved in Fe transport
MLARIALALALVAPTAAKAAVRVGGTVVDTDGEPVPVAIVTLRGGGQEARTSSDLEGKFELSWDGPEEVTALVDAEGFAARRQPLRIGEIAASGVTFVMAPAAFGEEVTVTGGARRADGGESAASIVVLSREELSSHPSPALDDALRQVPGFTLFRRSGSRAANPTAQGVTLRALGGSGASRALVLDDGVPLNDPFGGWVYWNRTPQGALDRVEVLRGGASNRYGSGALTGVVNLVRADGGGRRLDVNGSVGTQRTYDVSGFAQASQDRWIMRVGADAFTTGGYVTVPGDVRGDVDVATTAKYLGEEVALEYGWSGGTRLFARGNIYGEKRENGTPLQRNETEIKQLAIGFDRPYARAGAFTVRAWLSDQFYDQVFSAIAADRDREQLTREQDVAADGSGLSANWSHGIGAAMLMLGADTTRVEASNAETSFLGAGGVTTTEGAQRNKGAYADLALPIGRGGSLTFGARYDKWRNEGEEGNRSETAVSPRAALLLKPGRSVSVFGSAYRAFRAPTLNELYRSFRVGSVETLANAGLEAERIEGTEAGLMVGGRRASIRATAFRMSTEDTVSNVTLTSTPGLITRQRRNLGSARAEGVEIDAELRAGIAVFQAGWLRADATVRSFAADPTLVGLRLPQAPRDQVTVSIRLVGASGRTLALYGRHLGPQFDDDRNAFRLGRARVLDAFAALPVTRSFDFLVMVDNVLNERYEVGRTPILTIGPPRAVRAGLRLRLASLPVAQPD